MNGDTDVYHVVIQDVRFSSDEDFEMLQQALLDMRRPSDAEDAACYFYAYCLTPGCAHLLLRERRWKVAEVVEHLSGFCYDDDDVKYDCEPCFDANRFLVLLTFVHQTPVREGLTDHPGEYGYSSWTNDYLALGAPRICDTRAVIRRYGFDAINEKLQTPLDKCAACLDYLPFA